MLRAPTFLYFLAGVGILARFAAYGFDSADAVIKQKQAGMREAHFARRARHTRNTRHSVFTDFSLKYDYSAFRRYRRRALSPIYIDIDIDAHFLYAHAACRAFDRRAFKRDEEEPAFIDGDAA